MSHLPLYDRSRSPGLPMRFEGHRVAPSNLVSLPALARSLGMGLMFFLALLAYTAGVGATAITGMFLASVIFGWSGHHGPGQGLAISAAAGLAMGTTYWSVRAVFALRCRMAAARPRARFAPVPPVSAAPLFDRQMDGGW